MKSVYLWMVFVLLLLPILPTVASRWEVEDTNRTYEIAFPFEEIVELTSDGTLSIEGILQELRGAGVNTVSFNPLQVSDLVDQGVLSVYTQRDLELILQEHEDYLLEGFYFDVPESPFYQYWLEKEAGFEKITIGKSPYYFSDEQAIFGKNIGYDLIHLEMVQKMGFQVILRMENENEKVIADLVAQAKELNSDSVRGILFSKDEVIGYPDGEQVKKWARELMSAGYFFYFIEFSKQPGMTTLARETDYEVVRLHSINLARKSVDASVDQAVRAVKERNIRSIYFHFLMEDKDPRESLDEAVQFVKGVMRDMPAQFVLGSPEPFAKIERSEWVVWCALAAGVVFTLLTSRVLRVGWLRGAAVLVMILVGMAYFVTGRLLFLQAFALFVAVMSPIYAVLAGASAVESVSRGAGVKADSSIEQIGFGLRRGSKVGSGFLAPVLFGYLKAVGISFAGIWLGLSLLNGNAFITGLEVFRGVKLVYVVPLLVVAISMLWRVGGMDLKKFLNLEVRVWHLLVCGVVGAVGFYYILRTGNSGVVSGFELKLRALLEDLLYVRPRTKEFLIGFPLFVIGLYFMRVKPWIGRVLLIPSTIGFLSIVNTFTHFHIPLSVSVLRTVYSLVFGLIIGLVITQVVKMWLGRSSLVR